MKTFSRTLTCAVLSSLALPAAAQSWCEEAILTASPPELGARFGWEVDLEGDRAVIGSNFEFSSTPGKAFVFERQNGAWVEVAELTASDETPEQTQFGTDVAIDGDRILVGAPLAASPLGNAGRVYVFELQGGSWVETQNILAPFDTTGGGFFGRQVALDGEWAMVGDRAVNGSGGQDQYVYRLQGGTWNHVQTLQASHGNGMGSVSLDGDRALIGSHFGSAAVFELQADTWVEAAVLTSPTTSAVGRSVALDGDRALFGSHGSDARIFDRQPDGTWTETQVITPSIPNGEFGRRVALDGDRALVSSRTTSAAFVFELQGGGWVETEAFVGPDIDPDLFFAVGVALDGDQALVGYYASQTGGASSEGAAVAFTFVSGQTPASSTVRNGSGVNPVEFSSVTQPAISTSWQSSIETLGNTAATVVALSLAGPDPGSPSPFGPGELLIPIVPLPILDFANGAHAIPVPCGPGLEGLSLSTQGFRVDLGGLGSPSIVPLNALDLVLGS